MGESYVDTVGSNTHHLRVKQENRNFIPNPGYTIINSGKVKGTIVGGNLCIFNLLHGTEFMPPLKDAILFIEDDEMSGPFTDVNFDRELQRFFFLI